MGGIMWKDHMDVERDDWGAPAIIPPRPGLNCLVLSNPSICCVSGQGFKIISGCNLGGTLSRGGLPSRAQSTLKPWLSHPAEWFVMYQQKTGTCFVGICKALLLMELTNSRVVLCPQFSLDHIRMACPLSSVQWDHMSLLDSCLPWEFCLSGFICF